MVYLSTTSDEGSSADETTTSRREKDKKSPTSKDTVHELRSDLKRAEQTIGSFALKNAKAEERIEKLEAQLESAKRQLKETKAKLAAGEMAAEPVVVSPRSFGESDSQIHGGRKLFGVFYDVRPFQLAFRLTDLPPCFSDSCRAFHSAWCRPTQFPGHHHARNVLEHHCHLHCSTFIEFYHVRCSAKPTGWETCRIRRECPRQMVHRKPSSQGPTVASENQAYCSRDYHPPYAR